MLLSCVTFLRRNGPDSELSRSATLPVSVVGTIDTYNIILCLWLYCRERYSVECSALLLLLLAHSYLDILPKLDLSKL